MIADGLRGLSRPQQRGGHHQISTTAASQLRRDRLGLSPALVDQRRVLSVAAGEAVLDAGARLDLRDTVLLSTPLGWACRWGRIELVRLFLTRGADPIEAGAEQWARPRAWAERMNR